MYNEGEGKIGKCPCGNTEFERVTLDIVKVTKTKGAYTDEFISAQPSDDDLTCTKCGKRFTDCKDLEY